MVNRITKTFAAIVSLLLALLMLLGVGGAWLDIKTVSAAESAAPYPDAGWYVVGNGAGDLKTCSWTEYLPDWRLEGEEDGKSTNGYTNYLGIWCVEDLLMYEGDEFLFLYSNGVWENPNNSGWGEDILGWFNDITDNTGTSFVDGGLGNIQANVSGYYTFYLVVVEDAKREISIEVSFEIVSTDVPQIVQFDMYVVGSIASVPSCGWPGMDGIDVAADCIKMTYDPKTDTWSAKVDLIRRDEFKVYNTVNNAYYPKGINNNATGYTGAYIIQWESNAPDIHVFPAETGWFTVGCGAGSLKDCTWLSYLPTYRLTGISFDDAEASYQNYLGFWQTESLLLYQGDQFKFVYDSGEWATPNIAGWGSDIVADYTNLSANNTEGAFSSVGFDNIQVNVSGYYTFYLYVGRTANGVSITLTYKLDSKNVPGIDLEEMFIVGKIASEPSCGWPNYVNVEHDCIRMQYSKYDGKWYSPALYLTTKDEIKVYNLKNDSYYPSGVGDNYAPPKDGMYIIQWETGNSDFVVFQPIAVD